MVHLPADDIDEMAGEFTQLVDDLGYSKTFYPASKTTTFLNTEASKRYLSIYKNRREEKNRILQFFTEDLPLAVAKHHKVLLICFICFMLFYVVGFYSAMKDESIVRDILGDSYVRQTEKNIADGNPFGIYQTEKEFSMWISIMLHNIEVAFMFFLRGLLFPFFTIQYLVQNAMMVGVFDEFFYIRGLGNQFILAVMIHGILELSAIVIAAASGIVLGKGWLFPGELSRLDGFKLGAKEGMKIFIGVVPILMIAAFFEGFVTRHYNSMPLWINISILLASTVFIIGYFVLYPFKLKKKHKQIAE